MDKSIDLGKLQSEYRAAQALTKSALRNVSNTHDKLERARDAHERAAEKYKEASEALDKMKRTMLEAARTVASS